MSAAGAVPGVWWQAASNVPYALPQRLAWENKRGLERSKNENSGARVMIIRLARGSAALASVAGFVCMVCMAARLVG